MPAPLLSVSNLSKEYHGQKIFSGLYFNVAEKQKIGIIGRNGAGKSTLFRIIQNEEHADNGEVFFSKEARLGWFKQEDDCREGQTALEYLLSISGKEDWVVRKLAARFELTSDKLNQAALDLSGGWRMRLRLVAMLVQDPNLVLLDEPTNYLDLQTLILLENYLHSFKGSCLIISHDREFLKKTCDQTLEISATNCYHYPGPLEEYLAFKEQRAADLIKANQGLERQQEHLKEFVERFRYKSSKAKQAQSMMKKIEKLEAKRITIEHQAGITRIVIPSVVKRKSMALRIKNLSIGYNQQSLVSGIDLDMAFGERLAVLGANGQGKTTLLKTLASELDPIDGAYHWFSGGKIGYHSQEARQLANSEEQVGNYLRRHAAPDVKTEQVLKMAGNLLFKEDDLKKEVRVLSGGEKSRLVLGGILLSKPDILILDEPTTHFDFETVEALGSALKKFNGAIVFTSHDRTFTNLLATRLLQIDNGTAKTRYQDYEDYVAELEARAETKTLELPNQDKKDAHQEYLEQKARQRRLEALEKELKRLNMRHAELMLYFTDHSTNYSIDKVKELDKLNEEIRRIEDEWLNVA